MIDFDKILDDLQNRHAAKRSVALAKAKCEIDAINRAHEEYLDGIYDAVRSIKKLYEAENGGGK